MNYRRRAGLLRRPRTLETTMGKKKAEKAREAVPAAQAEPAAEPIEVEFTTDADTDAGTESGVEATRRGAAAIALAVHGAGPSAEPGEETPDPMTLSQRATLSGLGSIQRAVAAMAGDGGLAAQSPAATEDGRDGAVESTETAIGRLVAGAPPPGALRSPAGG